MDINKKHRITANLAKLIELTHCTPGFLARFIAVEVLTWEEVQIIEAERTEFARSKKFYDILITRTQGFEVLLDAAKETDQSGVVNILEQAELKYAPASTAANEAESNYASGLTKYYTLQEERYLSVAAPAGCPKSTVGLPLPPYLKAGNHSGDSLHYSPYPKGGIPSENFLNSAPYPKVGKPSEDSLHCSPYPKGQIPSENKITHLERFSCPTSLQRGPYPFPTNPILSSHSSGVGHSYYGAPSSTPFLSVVRSSVLRHSTISLYGRSDEDKNWSLGKPSSVINNRSIPAGALQSYKTNCDDYLSSDLEMDLETTNY